MKRLISEEEIKTSNPSEWCKVSDRLFISADFAEKELRKAALYFNYWCWCNSISPSSSTTYFDDLSNKHDISEDDIFDRFINEIL